MPAMSYWRAEPHHMRRLRVRVGCRAGRAPGPRWAAPRRCRGRSSRRRSTPGCRCDVDGLVEAAATTPARRWPRSTCAQHRAGDGAADGGVQVRGEPVLGVRRRRSTAPCSRRTGAGSARTGRPASGSAARPTRPAGSRSCPGRPGRRCRADRPVGGQGQGEEHRRPVLLAVRGGEGPADGPVLHRHPGRSGASCRRRVDRTRRAPARRRRPGRRRRSGRPGRAVVGRAGRVRWSRCQPSAHCCIRSTRAFRAQGGQTASRVEPQAIGTRASVPVSRSWTRRIIGRMHTPVVDGQLAGHVGR